MTKAKLNDRIESNRMKAIFGKIYAMTSENPMHIVL